MNKMKSVITCLVMVCLITDKVSGQTKPAAKAGNSSTAAASAKSDLLTNKNITDLHKAGLGDEIILTKIAGSKCNFDLSADALVDLKAKGVSSDVIKAMMNKETGVGASARGASSSSTPSVAARVAGAPELINHIYAVQKGLGTLQALEKSVAGKRTKNYGIKGVVLLQVEGAGSGVFMPADKIDYFLINTGGGDLPELTLYILKSDKGKREVESMSVGTFTGVKTNEKYQIPLNISKEGNGVFKITPNKTLEKGEYFFTTKPEATATSFDVYSIGIR